MATENEPAKLLLPYLQRADELQAHEPLVAYYCRLYAMERGLRIPQSDRTKIINALLFSLMNQLEKDKKSLKLGPDDNLHVEGFSLSVFEKADKQDRAGRANLNTAKTFYAASIFFEILNQFGELHPDVEQKQKYAAWKAADIRKSLKEGRKPVPGPPAGDKDQSVPLRSTSTVDYEVNSIRLNPNRTDSCARNLPSSDLSPQAYNQDNLPHFTNIPPQSPNVTSSPSSSICPSGDYSSDNFDQPPLVNNSNHSVYPNLQSYPSFTESGLPSAPFHYQATMNPSTAQCDSSCRNSEASERKYDYDSSSYEPPAEKIAEAHKAARFAVGALAFDDVSVAVDYIKKSLHLLTNPSTKD